MTDLSKSILKVRETAANLVSNPVVKVQLGGFIKDLDLMFRNLDADMKAADETDANLNERLRICEGALRDLKVID